MKVVTVIQKLTSEEREDIKSCVHRLIVASENAPGALKEPNTLRGAFARIRYDVTIGEMTLQDTLEDLEQHASDIESLPMCAEVEPVEYHVLRVHSFLA